MVVKIAQTCLRFVIWPLANVYWIIFRFKREGVKVIIRHKDKILLVKHSYGRNVWHWPGGGIKKGETPEQAAKREVLEEVGIKLDNLKFIKKYNNKIYKNNIIYLFEARVENKNFKIDNIEIKQAKWEKYNSKIFQQILGQ